MRDACAGTATDLPWAITLSGGGVGRHPVEIYAGLAFLVAAAAVNRIGLAAGVGAGAALALAAGIRLATEPLRASLTGGPVWWYWAGVAAGVLVVITAQRAARHGGLHSPA